jgi:hypothetical protein
MTWRNLDKTDNSSNCTEKLTIKANVIPESTFIKLEKYVGVVAEIW